MTRVGNAAAQGARDLLLSVTRRTEIAALVARIEHVELEAEMDFFERFVDGMRLTPIGQPTPVYAV